MKKLSDKEITEKVAKALGVKEKQIKFSKINGNDVEVVQKGRLSDYLEEASRELVKECLVDRHMSPAGAIAALELAKLNLVMSMGKLDEMFGNHGDLGSKLSTALSDSKKQVVPDEDGDDVESPVARKAERIEID